MPLDPMLSLFGDDPEAVKELERIKALRGEINAAKRLQRLGAVGALASDQGLQGFGQNLYRTGTGQEADTRAAMDEGYRGLKQSRAKAQERAEEQAWREKQHADEQAYRKQQLDLQRAQEARMAAQAARAPQGSWITGQDDYTGEKFYFNPTTGARLDSRGRPVNDAAPAQGQGPSQPAPTSGAISAPGAAQGAFGMPAPQVGGAQFAGGQTPQPQAPATPRASRVLFKDRPGVEGELQKTTEILRKLGQMEGLYQESGGLGFGRGVSLPTPTAAQYDKRVAELAPDLFKLARTPGEGAQSDFEAKMKAAAMPYRVLPGDVMGVPESGVEESQKALRETMENRVRVLGQQLGYSDQEIEATLQQLRSSQPQAGGGAGRTMTFNPQTGRVE